ncbi:MAG TPA: nucleotidyltransferase domain-containing protein [Kiloniellaceae bacterium]|nr:nucleotidyltransferase domain-containing protein [Kiloniellaceae bacterium]
MTALAYAPVAAEPRALIAERLDAIERDHDVRLLFAIESGSRAWGFPSPDSDYDVRFVYVHRPEWYLSIEQRRDVIELPIEGDLDINGWDLRKALALLLKPNPVLLEWLRSPIVYRADGEAMVKLVDLAEKTAYRRPSAYHYLHLCRGQYRRFVEGKERVKLKTYFYALRPALALMWLRRHPDRALPMNFAELRAGLELPAGLSDFLDEMLARKARSRELGEGPRLVVLDALIEEEMARAELALPGNAPATPDLAAEADTLFRDLVCGDAAYSEPSAA